MRLSGWGRGRREQLTQLVRADWLDEAMVHAPEAQVDDRIEAFNPCDTDDDNAVAVTLAQRGRKLRSSGARHLHVKQHAISQVFDHASTGRAGVVSHADLVAVQPEQLGHRVGAVACVIDNKQLERAAELWKIGC